jgi:hypothetical protein
MNLCEKCGRKHPKSKKCRPLNAAGSNELAS